MKVYIGTKIIKAEPMSRYEFEKQAKWVGRFDPRLDRPGYKVRYEDGYESWSPKEAFELAYREITPLEMQLILVTGSL